MVGGRTGHELCANVRLMTRVPMLNSHSRFPIPHLSLLLSAPEGGEEQKKVVYDSVFNYEDLKIAVP